MEHRPNNEAGVPVLAAIIVVLLLALSACSAAPPRSYAQPGVPSTTNRQLHDAAYYTGADPAFPRTGKVGGGAGGQ